MFKKVLHDTGLLHEEALVTSLQCSVEGQML